LVATLLQRFSHLLSDLHRAAQARPKSLAALGCSGAICGRTEACRLILLALRDRIF
jgi:hypothetical protein